MSSKKPNTARETVPLNANKSVRCGCSDSGERLRGRVEPAQQGDPRLPPRPRRHPDDAGGQGEAASHHQEHAAKNN